MPKKYHFNYVNYRDIEAMSDDELERISRQKLAQLRKRLLTRREEKKESGINRDLLNRVFVGRAWEVFNATQQQYPQAAKALGDALAQLVSSGKIEKVTGGELYYLLRKLGLRVKLKTRIRVKEHGKLISLEEKMKG
jgi:DNA-binding TFAR19-related protein (PDSD5 family)